MTEIIIQPPMVGRFVTVTLDDAPCQAMVVEEDRWTLRLCVYGPGERGHVFAMTVDRDGGEYEQT